MRLHSIRAKSAGRYFEPVPVDSVRRSTIRSTGIVLASQGAKFVIAFLTVAIMARILTPSDYGIFALLLVVVNFIWVFSNLGLSAATVQRKVLTPDEASSLFWVNLTAGVAMALLCFAISPLVAAFFHEPALRPAISVMGTGFIFSSAGIQHRALLMRVLSFGSIAICELSAQVLSSLTGIALAVAGAGYWSLVALQVSYGIISSALFFCASGWTPRRVRHPLRNRQLFQFGANVTGFSIANFFGKNLDNILIGKVYGSFQLGNYSRAYNLLVAPLVQIMYPIEDVIMSALSRIGVDNRERFRNTFLSIGTKLNLCTMPLIAFAIVDAHSIVRIALGPQWDEAAKIFYVLGIGGLVEPMTVMTSWLFVGEGRTRDYLITGLVGVPVMIVGFLVGLPYGPVGVATGYTVVTCVGLVPLFWFVGRSGPVSSRDLYRTLGLGAAVAGAVAVGAVFGREVLATGSALVTLLTSGAFAVCAGCIAVAAIPRARTEVRELYLHGMAILRGGGPRASV